MRTRSSLTVLFLIVFADLLGFGMVIPLLPRYGEIFGASPASLGIMLASYSLLQFLFAPIWGGLSDRFGRRPILLLSLVGAVIGYGLFAAARSIFMLILARSVAGIMAANISTAQAYIADVTAPGQRARGMGLLGAAFGLGFTLGPFIGGLLASLHEMRAVRSFGEAVPPAGYVLENIQGLPGVFAALLSLVSFMLALAFLPESRPPGRALSRRPARLILIWDSLRDARVGIVFILFFIYTLGFTQMEVTLAQLIGHRFALDITRSYWLFAWVGLLGALVQGLLIGPLSRRFGETVLASSGILIVTSSLALISFVPSVGLLMAVLALLALGAGISSPALSALVSRLTPSDKQGRTMGVFQSISSIARIVGPIIAQLLYQNGAHVHAPYLLAAGAGAVGFVLSLRLLGRVPSSVVSPLPPARQDYAHPSAFRLDE